jgi:hypothetical protein
VDKRTDLLYVKIFLPKILTQDNHWVSFTKHSSKNKNEGTFSNLFVKNNLIVKTDKGSSIFKPDNVSQLCWIYFRSKNWGEHFKINPHNSPKMQK